MHNKWHAESCDPTLVSPPTVLVLSKSQLMNSSMRLDVHLPHINARTGKTQQSIAPLIPHLSKTKSLRHPSRPCPCSCEIYTLTDHHDTGKLANTHSFRPTTVDSPWFSMHRGSGRLVEIKALWDKATKFSDWKMCDSDDLVTTKE